MSETQSYEAKLKELDEILVNLDNLNIPIDELGKQVKRGVVLIKELEAKLFEVETEVKNAFDELREPKPEKED